MTLLAQKESSHSHFGSDSDSALISVPQSKARKFLDSSPVSLVRSREALLQTSRPCFLLHSSKDSDLVPASSFQASALIPDKTVQFVLTDSL